MAATVVAQIGQCGNQLGEAVLDAVFEHCVSGSADSARESADALLARRHARELFFQGDAGLDEEEELAVIEAARGVRPQAERGAAKRPRRVRKARALLIDMEPRVIDECLRARRAWAYDAARSYKLEGGSGNNWAQGFLRHGPRSREALLELFRREAEAAGYVESVVVVQSAAGGTGSGLGTYLTQALADDFPNATRINVLVWPHASGEVVVQNYNTVLTMAHLQECSHAMVCLSNDEAHSACMRDQRVERPELADLNRFFAQGLVSGLLAPSRPAGGASGHAQTAFGVGRLARDLCPLPSFTCVQLWSVPQTPTEAIPFSNNSWEALLRQARLRAGVSPDPHGSARRVGRGGGPVVLGRLVTARGRGAQGLAAQGPFGLGETAARFEECAKAPTGLDKSISCVSNSSAVLPALEAVAERSNRMFSTGAYAHQYARYGLSRDDMQAALVGFEQTLQDYSSL